MSKMHYFCDKFPTDNGDLKLRDLAKSCFYSNWLW